MRQPRLDRWMRKPCWLTPALAATAAPRLMHPSTTQVHKMLIDVVDSLVAGGETGIFTPMHLLVFRKPLTAK